MTNAARLNRNDVMERAARVAQIRAEHYCNLLIELSQAFEHNKAERESALARIRTDWHNFLDAHGYAAKRTSVDGNQAHSLARTLLNVPSSVLGLILAPTQKIGWWEALLLKDADHADEKTLVVVGNLANAYAEIDQVKKSIEILEKLSGQARELGLDRIEAHAVGNLANLFARESDLDRAMEYQIRSLDMQRRMKNRIGEASVLNNIGHIYRRRSEYVQAEDVFRSALEIFVDLNERRYQATVLGGLGTIARLFGKPREALGHQVERLAIIEELGSETMDKVNALSGLGLANYELESYEEAERSFLGALKLARELKSRASEAANLGNLGLVYAAQDEHEKAYECYEQQLSIAIEVDDRLSQSNALGSLGNAARHLKRLDDAIRFKQDQKKLAEQIDNPKGQANALGGLGNLYLAKGEHKRAWAFHEQSLKIFQDIGDIVGEARQFINGTHILVSEKEFTRALDLLDQAEQLLDCDRSRELKTLQQLRQKILDQVQ